MSQGNITFQNIFKHCEFRPAIVTDICNIELRFKECDFHDTFIEGIQYDSTIYVLYYEETLIGVVDLELVLSNVTFRDIPYTFNLFYIRDNLVAF